MVKFHLFIYLMILLLGANSLEDLLPLLMTGILSGELVLVGVDIVCLELPVLPLAL